MLPSLAGTRTPEVLCTIGPASLNERALARFEALGVSLLRINLSHTPVAVLESWVSTIRKHSSIPICFDTQGAQVRTGITGGGTIELRVGELVVLDGSGAGGQPIPLYPPGVAAALRVGDLLTVDFDGAMLQVQEAGESPRARVVAPGRVGSNKAVTVNRSLPLRAITAVDEAAIEVGRRLGIRCFALSFANSAADVEAIRWLVGDDAKLIAKIESRAGVERLDSIMNRADAILIDRGDLSREVPLAEVPRHQKQIIARANHAGVPVYVATNLLESMVTNPRPTRAEVSDVMNTLLDGADGLVLAAETAVGAHPIGCVQMVRSLVEEFQAGQGAVRGPSGTLHAPPSRLVAAHGGRLIRRVRPDEPGLQAFPAIDLDERAFLDLWQIATGGFSPLEGFMTAAELDSVLASYRLPTGFVWPLPVLLQQKDRPTWDKGTTVALRFNGRIRGVMVVADVFQRDPQQLARAWFLTTDQAHPGVSQLWSRGGWCIGGPVELLEAVEGEQVPFDFTPSQARQVFEQRSWDRVLGFHTRNVPHRVHEFLIRTAAERHHCDGVFLHPVVGPKREGDFLPEVLLKAHFHLAAQMLGNLDVLVGGWRTYPRYAGPREAVFTALCRQNFGCSHFVIGRDHTGVGQFYHPRASRELCEALAKDFAITPVFMDEVRYCHTCSDYVEECGHDRRPEEQISGTLARAAIRSGAPLPEWFMRDSIYALLRDELLQGRDVFVR